MPYGWEFGNNQNRLFFLNVSCFQNEQVIYFMLDFFPCSCHWGYLLQHLCFPLPFLSCRTLLEKKKIEELADGVHYVRSFRLTLSWYFTVSFLSFVLSFFHFQKLNFVVLSVVFPIFHYSRQFHHNLSIPSPSKPGDLKLLNLNGDRWTLFTFFLVLFFRTSSSVQQFPPSVCKLLWQAQSSPLWGLNEMIHVKHLA